MTTRKKHVDWGSWIRSFGAAGLALVGVIIAFYFTTTNQLNNTREVLNRHDSQFKSIGDQFEKFNGTLQRNYDDWAKQNKSDQEKAERVREQFINTLSTFGANSAALKVQVDSVAKQLDSVTNKLDMIQDTQRKQR